MLAARFLVVAIIFSLYYGTITGQILQIASHFGIKSCPILSRFTEKNLISKIKLRFYYGNSSQYAAIPLDKSTNLLTHPRYNKSSCIVLYSFGFTRDPDSYETMEIINAYLENGDYNLFISDWTPVTKLNLYPDSASLVPSAGKAIAKAMDTLVDGGARLCHIAGHSLGAQLSGQIGRHMKNPVPHIIALDPAGPLFYPPEKCVDNILETDADCVEAIHTDGHMYGTLQKAGTVDIFVNGGVARQPGCQEVSTGIEVSSMRLSCSHDRAVFYMAEAVRNSSTLVARQCPSLDAFNRGQCNTNPTIHIGECDKRFYHVNMILLFQRVFVFPKTSGLSLKLAWMPWENDLEDMGVLAVCGGKKEITFSRTIVSRENKNLDFIFSYQPSKQMVTAKWNEGSRELAACDVTGKVTKWGVDGEEFVEKEQLAQSKKSCGDITVVDMVWSHSDETLFTCRSDGSVQRHQNERSCTLLRSGLTLRCCTLSPEDTRIYLGTSNGDILEYNMVVDELAQYRVGSCAILSLQWNCPRYRTSDWKDKSFTLAFALADGVIYFTQGLDDSRPYKTRTDMLGLVIQWSSSGEWLAVIGYERETYLTTLLILSPRGFPVQHVAIANTPVASSLEWVHNDRYIFLSTRNELKVVQVLFPRCVPTLQEIACITLLNATGGKRLLNSVRIPPGIESQIRMYDMFTEDLPIILDYSESDSSIKESDGDN